MKTRLACLSSLLALVLAVPAFSQTDTPAAGASQGPAQTIAATVVSSSSDTLVVKTDDGQERSFKVDASSDIPANLTPGTRINVAYHDMAGAVDHAARVTMASGEGRSTMPRAENEPAGTSGRMDSGTSDASGTAGTDDNLPATAGPLGHLVLAGFGALAAGLGLRRFSARA